MLRNIFNLSQFGGRPQTARKHSNFRFNSFMTPLDVGLGLGYGVTLTQMCNLNNTKIKVRHFDQNACSVYNGESQSGDFI